MIKKILIPIAVLGIPIILGGYSTAFSNTTALPSQSYSRDTTADPHEEYDKLVASMLGDSISQGVDTSISPCEDYYQFANAGWRSKAYLPRSRNFAPTQVTFFDYIFRGMLNDLNSLLDSTRSVHSTTNDQTLRVLGAFYESCLVADTLDVIRGTIRSKRSAAPDSSRSSQCRSRTLQHLGSAAGQAFADKLKRTGAVERMQNMLTELKAASKDMIRKNALMSDSEKEYALARLDALLLRVGIPEKSVDYTQMKISPSDYHGNRNAIIEFGNSRFMATIDAEVREKWKASLLTPNAFYIPGDHAVEIPVLAFSPPFFFKDGEDVQNYAGIGYIIAHEIFHGIAQQIWAIEDTRMKTEMDSFKSFNTSVGYFEGWRSNGDETFQEDIADMGGSRAAYFAWKSSIRKSSNYRETTIAGYNPDQRFFLALGRVWRAQWSLMATGRGVHAPYFARVNSMAMQHPQFKKAFGCKPGDRMYIPDDKQSKIW